MSARDDVRRAVDTAVESAVSRLKEDLAQAIAAIPDAAPAAPAAATAASGATAAGLEDLRREAFALFDGNGQVEILNRLMASVGHFWDRSVLYLVKGVQFTPWDVRGFEGGAGNAAVKALSVATSSDTILASALSGTGAQAENDILVDGLGAPRGASAAVALGIRNKPAAVLYCDGPKLDVGISVAAIEVLGRVTATSIELGMLTKRTEPAVRSSAVTATLSGDDRARPAMSAAQPSFAAPPAAPAPAPPAAPPPAASTWATPSAPEPAAQRAPAASWSAAPDADIQLDDSAPEIPGMPANVSPDATMAIPAFSFKPPTPEARPPAADATMAMPAFTGGPPPAALAAPAAPTSAAPAPAAPAPAAPAPAAPPAAAPGLLDAKDLLKGGGAKPVVDAGESSAEPAAAKFSRWKPVREQMKDGPDADGSLAAIPEVDRPKHVEAKKIARLLVSEIKLYNEAKVAVGRKNKDLYERLKEDIERSRSTYTERVQRIDRGLLTSTNYFRDELVTTLAEGDAEALGKMR